MSKIGGTQRQKLLFLCKELWSKLYPANATAFMRLKVENEILVWLIDVVTAFV